MKDEYSKKIYNGSAKFKNLKKWTSCQNDCDEQMNQDRDFQVNIARELQSTYLKLQKFDEQEKKLKKEIKYLSFLKNSSILVSFLTLVLTGTFILNFFSFIPALISLLSFGGSTISLIMASDKIQKSIKKLQDNRLEILQDALNVDSLKDYWYVKELQNNPECSYEKLKHAVSCEMKWFNEDEKDQYNHLKVYVPIYEDLNPYTNFYRNYVSLCSDSPYKDKCDKIKSIKNLRKKLLSQIDYYKLNKREIIDESQKREERKLQLKNKENSQIDEEGYELLN